VSISAVPFLLPLMFQVVFGMDAFHSGLLVLSVFAAYDVNKREMLPLICIYEIKPRLLINGALNVLTYLVRAFLTPLTAVSLCM
ncbi:MFS transporter, partial [Enterobacter hormaechei]|nr:MFS transporter [Enterobacter hormaechei]